MGCMLRSDPMTQCDMFLQLDSAYMVVSQLGEMGCVQFDDLHPDLNAFQRVFVLEICRISEIERKLRYINDKMRDDDIYIPKLREEPAALELHETSVFENIVEKWERLVLEMTSNLNTMKKTEAELLEMSYMLSNIGPMLGNADMLTANLGVIKTAVTGKSVKPTSTEESGGRLTVITGLVQRRRSYSFQLMLWRISHGCVFYKQADNDEIFHDSTINGKVRKVAFLLVVQGDELGTRMKKVCEGFRCDLYPMPATEDARSISLVQINSKIVDLSLVLEQTRVQRCKAMRAMARSYPSFSLQLRKAKATYHVLNLFTKDITKNCLIGRCWIPTSDLDQVQAVLDRCTQKAETSVPCFMSKISTFDTAPTFHRTNRFTYGFQMLISAYGDSHYREINPDEDLEILELTSDTVFLSLTLDSKLQWGPHIFSLANKLSSAAFAVCLYTIITFPFLFSLMFGDLGHGLIMLSVALWMVIKEKQLIADRSDSEIWNIMFGGRYIMLLMGSFSIYAGFVYNDCFSKAFTIFPTGWAVNSKSYDELYVKEPTYLLELKDNTYTYPFGKDPCWELARNKILFENSLKMKLSIIIGVIHMMFGLTVGLFNHIFFKSRRHLILLQYIPQILFLTCIFFWLVILIFFKWFKYGGGNPFTSVCVLEHISVSPTRNVTHLPFYLYQWSRRYIPLSTSKGSLWRDTFAESLALGQTCAPLVLILFIDMVLLSETKPVGEGCEGYMFPSQQSVQQILLLIAVICVPIMLFGPPCFAAQVAKKKKKKLLANVPDKTTDPYAYAQWEHEMEHASETFGDLMIHQGVETIEFVLSTISHTASYLRLWALSLAHAQLSEMLWAMIFVQMALSDHSAIGPLKIVIVFIIWGVFTINILVLMEGLSAFLHTLRLHWVEFMSKFFIGNGVVFKPFSFEALFADTKDKTEVCPSIKVFEY